MCLPALSSWLVSVWVRSKAFCGIEGAVMDRCYDVK